MYSRNGDRRIPPGISIPDNYGGNAFSQRGGNDDADRRDARGEGQTDSDERCGERCGTRCDPRCNGSQCRDKRTSQRDECRNSQCEEGGEMCCSGQRGEDCGNRLGSRREERCGSDRRGSEIDNDCGRAGCGREDKGERRQDERREEEGREKKDCDRSSTPACRDGFMSISIGAEELLLLGVMALVFFSGGRRDDELLICLLLVLLI